MKQLLPLALLICMEVLSSSSYAQQSAPSTNGSIRKAWMFLSSEKDSVSGYVSSASDSTLLFSTQKHLLKEVNLNHPELRTIYYTDIKEIYVHAKGGVWKGIGLGAIIGCTLGALVGAATYSEPAATPDQFQLVDRGVAAAGGAVIGTGVGILTGALIGAVAHKKFIIHGKKERFQHMQKKTGLLP